jgi:acetyl esterase/lipase
MPNDFRPAESSVYMLLGAEDTYVGTESCREYGNRLKAGGGNVVVKTYPKAKHGWDVPGPANWFVDQGQNYSKCVYDEIKKGTWVERTSKVVVRENDKPTGNAGQALARCMTLGVRGGYNRETHLESTADIRGYMREAFGLK